MNHKIYGLLFLFSVAVISASCSNFAHRKNSIEFVSYNTDIDGMSVQPIESKDNQHMKIMITQEPYVDCWQGHSYSVFSVDSGEEILKKDDYKFTEDQLLMEKDNEGTTGKAVKEFWIDMFDFKESGEYILHNEFYLNPREYYGSLDILVIIKLQ